MEDCEVQRFRCGDYSYVQSDVKMTRSRPDTRLSELEEQLEVAETRCGSLKSQLDYMKMLYQGVQPYSADSIRTAEELPQTQPRNTAQSSPRDPARKPSIVEEEGNYQESNTDSVADFKYSEFLKEIHKMQEITRELDHADHGGTSPRQSARSPIITQGLVEERESISAECRRIKQVRKTYTMLGSANEAAPKPMSMLTPVTGAVTSLQIPEVCNEHDIEDATASHHPYQHPSNYSARVQADLATARTLTSRFMSENNPECGENEVAEEEKETLKQELVLKLSESMDSARVTVKRKRMTKVDKKQKTGLSAGPVLKKTLNARWEDTLSVTSNNKSKKKKEKLRTAKSRNTVMSKETNLTGRKDTKKRKQKGYSSATHMPHRFQVPVQRLPVTRAEVVEIYHNKAVEGGSGSISISSSKHSKHEAGQLKNNNSVLKKAHPAQMCSVATLQHRRNSDGKKFTQEESCDARAAFEQNNNEEFQHSTRSQKSQNYAIRDASGEAAQCNSAPHPSRYYDPTITRNYELPTVASKLKKVNRSYFNRFNFRNIPFVVSTSISPSHNLGLNIQQVLSIMKTRQPMATGMTPLLIRKMSKGVKPVGTFLDQMNDSSFGPKSPKNMILGRQSNYVSCARPRTTAECTSTLIDEATRPSNHTASSMMQNQRFNHNSSDEKKPRDSLLEEHEDMPVEMNRAKQQESGCICCPKKSKSYNRILKQYTSRKSITGNPTLTASTLLRERQEEINIGDNQYNKTENVSANGKGIREVLINLHDQFEELNIAYEKLQEQAAKSNDKSIKKQITALEKELNAKEEEINAVVGLYKEVLQLKQQIHSTHGNNSFVCISTSNNPLSPVVRRSGQMRTQLVANPMQIFNMRSKSLSLNTREPATVTRLAGLLREIQCFQKQLLAL